MKTRPGNNPPGPAPRGFTLIELLVTMTIVAILAAVAIPSYSQYTQKARRADAKTALELAKSRAEKYFLNNGKYPTAVSPGTAALTAMSIPATSERGYYSIRYAYDGGALSSTNPAFQAVAVSSEAQQADTDCRTFTAGLDGTRSAFSSGNANTTGTCW